MAGSEGSAIGAADPVGHRSDQYGPLGVSDVGRDDLGDLQAFVVQLGAGLSAAGEPVDVVQQQLAARGAAPTAPKARASARSPPS